MGIQQEPQIKCTTTNAATHSTVLRVRFRTARVQAASSQLEARRTVEVLSGCRLNTRLRRLRIPKIRINTLRLTHHRLTLHPNPINPISITVVKLVRIRRRPTI